MMLLGEKGWACTERILRWLFYRCLVKHQTQLCIHLSEFLNHRLFPKQVIGPEARLWGKEVSKFLPVFFWVFWKINGSNDCPSWDPYPFCVLLQKHPLVRIFMWKQRGCKYLIMCLCALKLLVFSHFKKHVQYDIGSNRWTRLET